MSRHCQLNCFFGSSIVDPIFLPHPSSSSRDSYSYIMSRPQPDMDLISTGHSAFLKPSLQQGHPARSLILRGINLSSSAKFPHYSAVDIPDASGSRAHRDHRRWMRAGVKSHESAGLWDEAETGGREGWFNGAPFPLDEADVSQPPDCSTIILISGPLGTTECLGFHNAAFVGDMGSSGTCWTVSLLDRRTP